MPTCDEDNIHVLYYFVTWLNILKTKQVHISSVLQKSSSVYNTPIKQVTLHLVVQLVFLFLSSIQYQTNSINYNIQGEVPTALVNFPCTRVLNSMCNSK